ncbi:hypothetical protein CH373_14385 [Leptospira perolatii]|uniref:GrpB family protein n=1 Tax=Leptospira perolatii TaxID=2023191 RepID=A0A2M9ZK78_9LEPT|nr:GrpB family protein [Leptospira perolatii]PJZ69275.1 hypothetical protein CH360_12235 [Leptospira perolatii]PJZ72343.1 hypothetical protein CH373_14385 [Leptospira perolatii]
MGQILADMTRLLNYLSLGAIPLRGFENYMNLDEIIHLKEYQKEWGSDYLIERELLRCSFPENSIIDIQHIGSTSVKGMYAKPVIDIMIGLKSLEIDQETDQKLFKSGYRGFGEEGVAGKLYYRKRECKSINLSIVHWEDEIWGDNIVIRDYLQVHEHEILKYSNIKKEIYLKGHKTLLAYSKEKAEFMNDLLQRAKSWDRSLMNRKRKI